MPRAGNSNSDDIVVQGNQSPPSQTNTIVCNAYIKLFNLLNLLMSVSWVTCLSHITHSGNQKEEYFFTTEIPPFETWADLQKQLFHQISKSKKKHEL